MSPLERARLEKAAADCGFEREAVLAADGTLELRSAQFPEVVRLQSLGPTGYRVQASSQALLPHGDSTGVVAHDIEQLYGVLEQAAAAARTMPNRVADQFRQQTLGLSKQTEAERLVVQRVGQDLFRKALLDYWRGRCCVSGLAVPSLLRASHIKPWAQCATDDERLDVFNGLLLAPHIDALFDGGWITFLAQGNLMVSRALPQAARLQLGVSIDWRIEGLRSEHADYLAHHQRNVFKSA
jgi:hypothetical protein